MKKSCFTIVLAIMLILAVSLTASAASFSDISGHWAEKSIEAWKDAGLFNGYPDGTFRPNDSITRAEFAAVLNRILGLDAKGDKSFSDVAKDAWYYNDVIALAEAGIVDGESFRPTVAITREEAVVMFAKAFGLTSTSDKSFTDDAAISETAKAFVKAMVAAGYIQGYPDGSFGPAKPITRAEAVKILDNASVIVKEKMAAQKPADETPADTKPSGVVRPSNGGTYHESHKTTPTDLMAYVTENAPLNAAGTARALPIDRTETNETPIVGFFSYTLTEANYGSYGDVDGRQIYIYAPNHTALRNYITIIAIPDGVKDVYAWLDAQGWIDVADAQGELLFILTPGRGGWGTPAQEADYLEACIGESIANTSTGIDGTTRAKKAGGIVTGGKVKSSDGFEVPCFTGHGCNYYVGYGEGCAPLESWTSTYPLWVIGQAFIGGQSVGQAYLNQAGKKEYNGINVSSYGPGPNNDDFHAMLQGMVGSADFMTNADIPVPTLLAGYGANDVSVTYWKNANDATVKGEDGVFWQAADSDAWQTEYANYVAAGWGLNHGISQVKVDSSRSMKAEEVYSFLSMYTRYTFQFAYSNNLALRMDYISALKDARYAAESGKALATYNFVSIDSFVDHTTGTGTVELRALAAKETDQSAIGLDQIAGEWWSGIMAYNDYDGNDTLDPREFLIYVPEGAVGQKDVPVVFAHPGNTNSAMTFGDGSGWWQVAQNEDCVVIFVGEYCKTSAAALTYGTNEDKCNYDRALITLLQNEIEAKLGLAIDYSRLYCSGHSAGSGTTQTLCMNTESSYFAAAGSTSGLTSTFTSEVNMPTFVSIGMADIANMVPEPWVSGSTVGNWVKGAMFVNDINVPIGNSKDSFIASCEATGGSYEEIDSISGFATGRFLTYTWNNDQGIPMVKLNRTLCREHNSYPENVYQIWNFLEKYSLDTETGVRYYSESAFAVKDQQAISNETDLAAYLTENAPLAANGKSRALPIDRTETNETPINGFFSYTLTEANYGADVAGRQIYIYAPKHTALRNYITIIALPEGVDDTYAWLKNEGWIDLANSQGELLFILAPGADGWGTPAEEAAYLETCIGESVGNDKSGIDGVTRAKKSGGIVQRGAVKSSDGFDVSCFTGHGCNYYVGYGEGCAPLESWTSTYPLYVIGQAFIGGESVGQAYLTQAAAKEYNGINVSSYGPGPNNDEFHTMLEGMTGSADFMANADIPVPTLFGGYGASDVSVTYWKGVNDATVNGGNGVYWQAADSDGWQTEYANYVAANWGLTHGISQVKVDASADLSAKEIYSFLSLYSRYTFQFAYSNNLSLRMDYISALKTARTAAESGEALSTYSFESVENFNNHTYGTGTVELRALASKETDQSAMGLDEIAGEWWSGIMAFADYDGNGTLDPREFLIYVPTGAVGQDDVPVVFAHPGNTNSAMTFGDGSGWWQVANDEDCIVIFVGEYCRSGAAALTYGSNEDKCNYDRAVIALLQNEIEDELGVGIDYSRVYNSGHSAGSGAAQTLSLNTESSYIAAVGSTSMTTSSFTSELVIPTYLSVGMADLNNLNAEPWVSGSGLHTWVTGALKVNGIPVNLGDDQTSFIQSAELTGGGFEAVDSLSGFATGRFLVYTWNNGQDIPMVGFNRTLCREHNSYPENVRQIWDFIEKYSLNVETGDRYYSESAFATAGDEVLIAKNEAIPMDGLANIATLATNSRTGVQSYSIANNANLTNSENLVSAYLLGTFNEGALAEGRSYGLYLSEHSAKRAYTYVIAVDSSVDDSYGFLLDEGWIGLAETYGENLLVLLPGEGGWGTPAQEADYLSACLREVISNTAYTTATPRVTDAGGVACSGSVVLSDGFACSLFSGHACHYFVSYGDACAPVESFTSMNPIYVVSQAFVGGESVGSAVLQASAAREYNGINTGSYYPGLNDAEYQAVLTGMKDDGYMTDDSFIKNDQIAVPTWFLGYAANDTSVSYWKGVNDVVVNSGSNDEQLWLQDQASNAWQTDYINKCIANWGGQYGISQVKVSSTDYADAASLRDFLAQYTRYSWQFAYSNNISYRLDYYAATNSARTIVAQNKPALATATYDSLAGTEATASLLALEKAEINLPEGDVNKATVYSSISSFTANKAANECLIYVPDSAKAASDAGKSVPVVFMCFGSGQTVSCIMDCSGWWTVANDNGFVLITFSANADFLRSEIALLKSYICEQIGVNIDFSRVYCSGHSAGCNGIQRLTHSTEGYYVAAVGGTSFPNAPSTFTYDGMMPSYLAVGQADISEPDQRQRDLVLPPWDTSVNSKQGVTGWINACCQMNGISFIDIDDSTVTKDDFLATCSSYSEEGRFYSYIWSNEAGIPLTGFTRTLAREHNCYPEEFPLIWDFLEHYSLDVETGVRYYSESAFESDDAVAFNQLQDIDAYLAENPIAIDFDKVTEHPVSGYFNYDLPNMEGRSVKLFMAEHSAIRNYITVVAVPDGVDTVTFLGNQGWFDLIQERGEILVALEPGEGGWGTAADESAYIKAAMNVANGRVGKTGIFSGHGCNYYVGYGEGCAPLEAWTAANPLNVASQVFVGGSSVGASVLNAAATTEYNGYNRGSYFKGFDDATFKATLTGMGKSEDFITNGDIPVPTWLVSYSADSDSLTYWKSVNDATVAAADGFYQAPNSDAWQTEYANQLAAEAGITHGISQVKVSDGSPKAAAIYDFLGTYTRYTTQWAYSNNLGYRLDYAPATKASRIAAIEGAETPLASYSFTDFADSPRDVELWSMIEKPVTGAYGADGTVIAAIMAFDDYDKNGDLDGREFLLYIPESVEGEADVPLVLVHPGMTQAASTFMDCSMWWALANTKGFAVAIVGQDYMAPTSIGYRIKDGSEYDDANFDRAMLAILKVQAANYDLDVDYSRVYASGHSLGSLTAQTLANNSESSYIAAVASTSFSCKTFTGGLVPAYLFIGQADISEPTNAFSGDFVPEPWTVADGAAVAPWINGKLTSNTLAAKTFEPGDKDAFLATCSSVDESGRFHTYTWNNDQNVPLVKFTRTLAREHNCIPAEFELAWDFLSCYSLNTVTGERTYSPSAFVSNDLIVIDND